MWYIRLRASGWAFQDGDLRKHIHVSTNLCIHASINSLVTYKLKGLGTFLFIYSDVE